MTPRLFASTELPRASAGVRLFLDAADRGGIGGVAFPLVKSASGGAAGYALSPTSRSVLLRAAQLRALLCADGGCHLPARSAGGGTLCGAGGPAGTSLSKAAPEKGRVGPESPRSATEQDPETLKNNFGATPRKGWNFLDHLTTSVTGLSAHTPNHQMTIIDPGSWRLSFC